MNTETTERPDDLALLYLLASVETHADKFPAPGHMRSLVQRIRENRRSPTPGLEKAVEALRDARAALYNGFEPDNQSRAWHKADAALRALQGGNAPMKVLALVACCDKCANKRYYSGGRSECIAAESILPFNMGHTIPEWCPLTDYPAAAMERLRDRVTELEALQGGNANG